MWPGLDLRRRGSAILGMLAAVATGACSADDPKNGDRPGGGGAAERATEPPLDDAAVAVLHGADRLGLDLYGHLRADPGNVLLSPLSIAMAMNMALSGAQHDTRDEMARILHQRPDRDVVDPANRAIRAHAAHLDRRDGISLRIANALCLTREGGAVSSDYRTRLAEHYAAGIFTATDVEPINAWVREQTQGRIDRLLDSLDPASVCVLLNAVWFKGLWVDRFDPQITSPGPFHRGPADVVEVPMMQRTGDCRLLAMHDASAIELPFRGGELAMVVILPEARGGLAALEASMTAERVERLLADLAAARPGQVLLRLPRFRMQTRTSLRDAFIALGMDRAFAPDAADFGAIAGLPEAPGLFFISQIRHSAFLEVNEEGSEAAAATGVEISITSAPLVREFIADHPFLFMIVDRTTRSILFLGRLADPLRTGA